eukprot:Gb_08739 [translate_table: standard]
MKVNKAESSKLTSSVVWKWRWAATASRLKSLLDRFNNSNSASEARQPAQHSRDVSLTEFKNGKMLVGLARKDLTESIPACRIQRMVLSMWHACAKISKLEKRVCTHTTLGDKIMTALPWWTQKTRERQKLRCVFLYWFVQTLRLNGKRKGMKGVTCMYDSFRHCCLTKRPDSSQSKSASSNSDEIHELSLLPSGYDESMRGGYQYWNLGTGCMPPTPKLSNPGTYVGYAMRQMGEWQDSHFGPKLSSRAIHAFQASFALLFL